MGTAANMNYVARSSTEVRRRRRDVTPVVTAGVQTNAVCAGDPASLAGNAGGRLEGGRHRRHASTRCCSSAGAMTAAALARAIVTMTEGKSAALQRLAVPSCYSSDLATGTGTDQFCVAAPLAGDTSADVGEPAHEVRRADRPDSQARDR